jgi:hypothetical protein
MKSPIPADAWQVLQAVRPNVLVIDPDPRQRSRTLAALLEGTREPVFHCHNAPLGLPQDEVGTLVVADVSCLTADEQRHLLAWAEAHRRTQIVTASPVPVFPAVAAGVFLDSLYYRINVMVLGDYGS